MQKVRRHSLILADRAPTVCKRPVSDLFHSPFGVLFTFPSRYLFAIGLTGVFSLTGWSRQIRAEFHVFRVTQDTTGPEVASRTGLSPPAVRLSRRFSSRAPCHDVVLLPRRCIATATVWALPRSLATTGGIIVIFFSSGY